jgi:hypothetical protein
MSEIALACRCTPVRGPYSREPALTVASLALLDFFIYGRSGPSSSKSLLRSLVGGDLMMS